MPQWRVTFVCADAKKEWESASAKFASQAAATWRLLQTNPHDSAALVSALFPLREVAGKQLPQRVLWMTPDVVVAFCIDTDVVWILGSRKYPSGHPC